MAAYTLHIVTMYGFDDDDIQKSYELSEITYFFYEAN